jgi:hypothetical protein
MPAHLAELEFVAELLESTDRPEWGKHVRLAIAEISALRAAAVGVNVGVGWQPIETAPKDGTPARVTGDRLGLYPYDARYEFGRWVFHGDQVDGAPVDPQPTRWMPLDASPSVGVNVGVRASTGTAVANTSAV